MHLGTIQNPKLSPIRNKLENDIQKTKEEVIRLTQGKTGEKIDHAESGNSMISYRNDPDWDSTKVSNEAEQSSAKESRQSTEEISIVKEHEVTDCLADLRLLLQVFEDNACKFLFKDKYLISVNLAKEVFQNKLNLSHAQSEKLARFLVEPNNVQKLTSK